MTNQNRRLIKVTFLALSALALAYILCLGEKKISYLRFGSLKKCLGLYCFVIAIIYALSLYVCLTTFRI
jgi:hypothetical protein